MEIVEQLNLGELMNRYGGGGKQLYHPALWLNLVLFKRTTSF
jgi:hypothetical protein